MTKCGNTGVIVGSEWCGLCRVHGCEGYKSYKQKCKNKKQGEIMGFKLDGYKVGFAANKPQITNCPNCGAPVTSGRCEYCNTVIYNEDDAKKEVLLELKRLETESHELKFKLAYDEMMADLKLQALKLKTKFYWRHYDEFRKISTGDCREFL